MNKILGIIIALTLVSGCAEISPFSPNASQNTNNSGEIDDIRTNQNGIMSEIGKLKQENEIIARDIENFQNGLINKNNSGVQILQGDGPLILIFGLGVIAMMMIYHYRSRSIKANKTASILAQQVTEFNDANLDNRIFMAALNTEVEKDIEVMISKKEPIETTE